MVQLPDWNELIDSDLNGLEQYLAWAMIELRRLAIAEGKQQTVRLAFGSEKFETEEGSFFEAILKAEVNLNYDSDLALRDGLAFVRAIKNVSDRDAILPASIHPANTLSSIKSHLDLIRDSNSEIDSLEKFLCYLLLAWNLSNNSSLKGINKDNFAFYDESNGGGIVKFKISIPLDYEQALKQSIVNAVYQSPYRETLTYQFPSLPGEIVLNNSTSARINNQSKINNNFSLIN